MIYRDARPEDGPALAAMARASFVATFGTLYPAPDLAAFLDDAFGPAGLPAQIADPAYRIRLAIETAAADAPESGEGAIVGFAKLGPCSLPPPAERDDAELKQLYLTEGWQGRGVSVRLMEWALDTARAAGRRRMVLSVWADNHRAKRFYARYGFAEIGRNPFRVGDQIDDDRIWSRLL